MNILLINPYASYAKGTEGVSYPPIGLLYLSSSVEEDGHEAYVLDASFAKINHDYIGSFIKNKKINLVGISVSIITVKATTDLCTFLRREFSHVTIVVGGPMPTSTVYPFLNSTDYIILGEGETSFKKLISDLSNNHVGKEKNKISQIISPSPLISDLNTLPMPNYKKLFPHLLEYSKKGRIFKPYMAPIMTSRGCPYKCTFCSKAVFGPDIRYRSPENVMHEIEYLRSEYGIRQIDILDDNFLMDRIRANKILDTIIERKMNIALNCHSGLRAEHITKDLAKKLKTAGAFKVGIGIETIDENLRKSIKKGLDPIAVENAIKWLREEKITVHGFFILGLPGDTPLTMQKTIDYAKKINPHFANFAICIPFPGTEMYKELKKNNELKIDLEKGIDHGFFIGNLSFETKETKREDVKKYFSKAFVEFYFRPQKFIDIVLSIHSFSEFKWIFKTSLSLIFGLKQKF